MMAAGDAGCTARITCNAPTIKVERAEPWSAQGIVRAGMAVDPETRRYTAPLERCGEQGRDHRRRVMGLAGRRLALAAVLCCVACAGHAADTGAALVVPLVNPGFEQPPAAADQPIPGWDTPVHADARAYAFALDTDVHHRGNASARITRTGHEPWGMISQALATRALRGHTLELSAWMRTGNADGAGAMLVIRTLAHGAVDQYVFQDPTVTATTPWTRYSVRLAIPASSNSVVEIGAMLQGGGTLWVDDVELVVLR